MNTAKQSPFKIFAMKLHDDFVEALLDYPAATNLDLRIKAEALICYYAMMLNTLENIVNNSDYEYPESLLRKIKNQ